MRSFDSETTIGEMLGPMKDMFKRLDDLTGILGKS